jgi:acetyl esterase/lipase
MIRVTRRIRLLPLSLFIAAFCCDARSAAQILQPDFLWSGVAPGSEGKTSPEATRITPEGEHVISNIHRPAIFVYLPANVAATGVAVLVIPGGGHREIWIDHEGFNIATWLNHNGVPAFVLKYRLAREPGSTYTVDGTELSDVQRAIRLIRSRAAEWGIDPNRLGAGKKHTVRLPRLRRRRPPGHFRRRSRALSCSTEGGRLHRAPRVF